MLLPVCACSRAPAAVGHSAKEQDLARIEFQRDGVFAEAKARVKIVLEEIDGWYLCLTEELKHREEVMRQQQTAEETEVCTVHRQACSQTNRGILLPGWKLLGCSIKDIKTQNQSGTRPWIHDISSV